MVKWCVRQKGQEPLVYWKGERNVDELTATTVRDKRDLLDPVYMYRIQPIVKPVEQAVEQPAASCKQTFHRLSNRLFNRLYRVNGVLVWQRNNNYVHVQTIWQPVNVEYCALYLVSDNDDVGVSLKCFSCFHSWFEKNVVVWGWLYMVRTSVLCHWEFCFSVAYLTSSNKVILSHFPPLSSASALLFHVHCIFSAL